MHQLGFKDITDAIAEPLILLDQKGQIISANQVASKQFGLAGREHTSLHNLLEDDPDKVTQAIQMWLRSKSPLPASLTFKGNDQQPLRYLCKGSLLRPQQHDEAARVLVQCSNRQQSTAAFVTLNQKVEQLKREIIERVNAEAEIRRLNEQLEQRVKERTAELERANAEIQRSFEELKSAQDHLVRSERLASLGSMVAGVAHEINNPVGVSVTAVSYLEEKVRHYRSLYQDETLTREDFESLLNIAEESTRIIHSNMHRAADLIRNFKQLAVDQSSNEYRSINLKHYLDELMMSFQPYFRHTAHRVELECADSINIESQPGSIAQILNNLISNSMIHGFEGVENGVITIRVDYNAGQLQIDYSDNGIGMEHKDLIRVFDPFFTTKRNQGGSGLGMNIVYNLVTNKLCGKIAVSSKPAEGVRFRISFPVTPIAEAS